MDGEIALRTWELYFPPEEYTIFNKEVELIAEIRRELRMPDSHLKEMMETQVFECDVHFFERFGCSASLLRCFSCAVSERILESFNEMVHIETKIVNHGKISQFGDVNASSVNSLVSVVGTCCRVGFKTIENIVVYFECNNCSRVLRVSPTNNIYRNPRCVCKGRSFVFLSGHPDTKCIDKQEIKIQEVYSEDGNIRMLEMELRGSLVGTVAPGDLIQATGIVKAELCGDVYKLKLECNNLSVVRNRNHFREDFCFDADFQTFRRISEESNLINVFADTLFPSIYGNGLIKTGIVLSLFGGTRKGVGSGLTRSEIHILIVGDPGLGKSRLLLGACGILPKSTYVSGNFCTASGLTVSITHDPITGEYMADAGALVVSDSGVCCIDEFDKIDDHTALFEAMEDQRVTVAKGGVCCSVSARSTIIAASNPRYGHFDAKKGIRENIKFDSAMLARFDLVYVLVDNFTEEENYEMSNQILKKRNRVPSGSSLCRNSELGSFAEYGNAMYSKSILKKYIEYARMSVHPVLSKAAKKKIKEYYMEIRQIKHVSVRNLESLIRLTESYAKLELKPVASLNHALCAINLYKKILMKDEAKKEEKKSFETLLREFIATSRRKTITPEELSIIIRQVDTKRSEQEYIEILNFRGLLIKSNKKEYKINLSS